MTSIFVCLIMLVGQYRNQANDKTPEIDLSAELEKLDNGEKRAIDIDAQLDKIEYAAPSGISEIDTPVRSSVVQHSQQIESSATATDLNGPRWKFNYYTLEKPMRAQLSGSSKVMQVSLTIMTHYDDRVIQNIVTHQLALRAGILDLMAKRTESDLRDPNFRMNLAEEIRIVMNSRLEKYEGFGGIEEVMFYEFSVK